MRQIFQISIGAMRFSQEFKSRSFWWVPVLVLLCSAWFPSEKAFAIEPKMSPGSAVSLRAKYTELDTLLRNNQFHRELYLHSTQSSGNLKGEIYAVVDYPLTTVNVALNNPAHWCDVLILHINIKYCHASNNKIGTVLTINLGRNYTQPLADTYRVEFNYHGAITTPDYFAVELNAKDGPLNTHDYHIWIEATSLKDGRTFLHFTYTYAFGLTGRLAMQSYLATIGRNKVGFTLTGKQPNGQPIYIQGVRGIVERNTMRYYLAIDAYLAALTAPPGDQLKKRLQHWYNATDQYVRQLHEVERNDYLEMKHNEYQRQQITQ